MEIWKDIPNYEGIYQASSLGRIRSAPNKVTYSKRHGERHWKSRIISPKGCSDYRKTGYRVTLWKDKKAKDFLVARLVCTTFHENWIDTKMTVNHIDGDRLNNNPDNLEWLSLADNIKEGFRTGLYQNVKKKISLEDSETGEIYKFGSYTDAEVFLGKNRGYISNKIKKGKSIVQGNNTEYTILICNV